jgi:hypothetical protein
MGLSRKQLFVKKEATTQDIALVLQTLWHRAQDISCTPLTRVSFHAKILMLALGGFRPGVVERIKYRQVSVELVRGPEMQQPKLVVTFTITQNKQRDDIIRKDQKDVYVVYQDFSVQTILLLICTL